MIDKNIIIMKERNYDEYVIYLKEVFPEFSTRYETLFGLVINGENLSILNLILNNLCKESRGEITKQEMEHEIGIGTMNAIEYMNTDLINKF